MTEETKILDKKAIRQRMLDFLCEKFPKAFFPLDKKLKPLDLKVFNEILSVVKDKDDNFIMELKIFMAWYTNRKQYYKTVVAGSAKRVNIHGDKVGDVLESHRNYARRKLEQLLQKEAVFKGLKDLKEHDATNQSKDISFSKKLKSAFEQREAALKARVEAVAANTSKPKLTLKMR